MADMFDEKVSGSRNASSIGVRPVNTTPTPSTAMTGMLSRSALNIGWGLAAISGSIPANGLASDASSGGVLAMGRCSPSRARSTRECYRRAG
jgi:hypothetical protein